MRMTCNRGQTSLSGLLFGALLIVYINMYYGTTINHLYAEETDENVSENSEKNVTMKLSECIFTSLTKVDQFMDYGRTKIHCKKLVPFGGPKGGEPGKFIDGQKMVCQDEEYKLKPGNCIVLSFGISNDWTFDDAMGEAGCKVYSFDPTIGLKDHNRSANVMFFNLGIGNSKRTEPFQSYTIEVDRYEGILQMLNITDRIIDYLKIDIEGTEVDFFSDVFKTSPQLLSNVKQIGMELHPDRVGDTGPPNSRMYPYWNAMNMLECLGFKLLSWEANLETPNPYTWRNRQESACYEVVWGNIH